MNELTPLIIALMIVVNLNQCESAKRQQEIIDQLHKIELKLDK